jgi:hypothetical protein
MIRRQSHHDWTTSQANAAMARAALKAREKAGQTGTPLVVWRDGKVVEIPPEALPDAKHRSQESGDSSMLA